MVSECDSKTNACSGGEGLSGQKVSKTLVEEVQLQLQPPFPPKKIGVC